MACAAVAEYNLTLKVALIGTLLESFSLHVYCGDTVMVVELTGKIVYSMIYRHLSR